MINYYKKSYTLTCNDVILDCNDVQFGRTARHGLGRSAGEVGGADGRQGRLLRVAAGAQQQAHGRALRRRPLPLQEGQTHQEGSHVPNIQVCPRHGYRITHHR